MGRGMLIALGDIASMAVVGVGVGPLLRLKGEGLGYDGVDRCWVGRRCIVA